MFNSTPNRNNDPVRFTLSLPSSAASSRSSSPVSFLGKKNDLSTRDSQVDRKGLGGLDESPGRLPLDAYDAMLPRWRALIRNVLLRRVESESKIIARMQEYLRTPFLDAYFVYTSSLGTHTFFMTAIPALFFFGYEDLGVGLILVLAFGVYFASVIKDLICSPRPFAPPVTRLTIGSHHLEYGFPSTHSTNSISIALFLFSLIHRLAYPSNNALNPSQPTTIPIEPALSPQTFMYLTIGLCFYAFSIVFGRLYTAMHCFTDCVMGVFLGALIWWAETSWTGIPVHLVLPSTPFHPTFLLIQILEFLNIGTPLSILSGSFTSPGLLIRLGHGLGLGSTLYSWVEKGRWEVPLILVFLCILFVNQHPQPVDDCPCFEDAIAFGSVVLGTLVGKWATTHLGISRPSVIMPGSGWLYTPDSGWIQVPRKWNDVLVWWGIAILKMGFGIFTIFAWRLLARSALRLALPPTYRLLSRAFRLPSRRFYTPATEYKSVPSDFSKEGGVLHTIPSVIDLPSAGTVGVAERRNGTAVKGRGNDVRVKMRLSGVDKEKVAMALKRTNEFDEKVDEKEVKDKAGETIKHYDADVLTKVVVYAGIAILVSEALPALYNYLGWGVPSWPVQMTASF